MSRAEESFAAKAFSSHPAYHEASTRERFSNLMPLRTVIIYCYDPRATGIPAAIARELDDVYPGTIVKDSEGNELGTTCCVLSVVVAGGRAIDALRSIAVAQHLFGVQNIAVVHHTHCGATSYTAEGIIDAYRKEHGIDLSGEFAPGSVCIGDFRASLEHDASLLRASPAWRRHRRRG